MGECIKTVKKSVQGIAIGAWLRDGGEFSTVAHEKCYAKLLLFQKTYE